MESAKPVGRRNISFSIASILNLQEEEDKSQPEPQYEEDITGVHTPTPGTECPNIARTGQASPEILPDEEDPKQKSKRTNFSAEQVCELERHFQIQRYVTPEARHALSVRLQLSELQIKTWYQNRRMKERRLRKDQCSPLMDSSLGFAPPCLFPQARVPPMFSMAPLSPPNNTAIRVSPSMTPPMVSVSPPCHAPLYVSLPRDRSPSRGFCPPHGMTANNLLMTATTHHHQPTACTPAFGSPQSQRQFLPAGGLYHSDKYAQHVQSALLNRNPTQAFVPHNLH